VDSRVGAKLPTESEVLATLRARFKDMKVENSRLAMIEEEVRDLLEETRAVVAIDIEREAQAAKRRQTVKFSEMEVVSIIGPSGSTKSTSMEKVIEQLNKARPGEEPVIMVTVRPSTRSDKQLHVQILEAFHDPQADVVRKSMSTYSPNAAIEAIRNIAREKGTYIVVLDEANNMIGQDEMLTARPMAKAIKGLVNEGVFSIIVMGTAKAHRLFEADPELNSRKVADINLTPVDLNVAHERIYFWKFVGEIDRQMKLEGIVEERIGLIEDLRSRAMVYDMSGGVPGNVVRILRIALKHAHRKKRRSIDWEDIEAGYYAWKTEQVDDNGQPIKVHDPFLSKPKAATLEAVKVLK
jgi:ABC-type dipeptide/oligopeptide/nickel transport system ATPase subunit